MNAAELLLFVVVVVGFVFGTIWFARRHPHPATASMFPSSDDTRLLVEEVALLRERVQVLERVVTDNHGSIDLDRRIEQLRDR